MKKIVFLFAISLTLASASCSRRNKPIQYVRVPMDSTTHNDIVPNDSSWMDEPIIMVPDESTGELNSDGIGDITEEDIEDIFAGGDIGKY